jgi:hypothetical protein
VIERVRRWYVRLSVLPPIFLGIALHWLRAQDGWSGWTAVGVLQAVIALSAVMGLLGLGLSIQARWTGERITSLILGTLISGSGAIYIFSYWVLT